MTFMEPCMKKLVQKSDCDVYEYVHIFHRIDDNQSFRLQAKQQTNSLKL